MKRHVVEPRSPEWHELRQDAWTASMAAVLAVPDNALLLQRYAAGKGVTLAVDKLVTAGVTQFFGNTLWTVWADKTGRIPRFKGNDHTSRGQLHEEDVIKLFESEKLMTVEREVTVTADGRDWLLASLDGLLPASSDLSVVSRHGFPLEAKCPAFHSRKKLFDAKKKGLLAVMGLPYYWCQMQHQMLACEAPYGWFAAAGFDEKKNGMVFPIFEMVPRDDEFLEQYEAAAKFYYDEFIYLAIEPPKLPSDERLLLELAEKAEFDRAVAADNVEVMAELYFAAEEAAKEATARLKTLQDKLVAVARKRRLKPADEAEDVDLESIRVSFSHGASVSWQKVAQTLAAGAPIPEATIAACTNKPREAVKVKALEE